MGVVGRSIIYDNGREGGARIRPLGVWCVKHIAINLPPMGMHWTNFIRVCLLFCNVI